MSSGATLVSAAAADGFLDDVERGDVFERLAGDRRWAGRCKLIEATPDMRPAERPLDVANAKASDRLACYERALPPSSKSPTKPEMAPPQDGPVDILATGSARLGAKMNNICRVAEYAFDARDRISDENSRRPSGNVRANGLVFWEASTSPIYRIYL